MTLSRSHRIGIVVASVSLVAATLAVVHEASAQGGPGGQGGQGGQFGPGGQGGPGFGGPGFGGPGFGGPGGPGFPGMMPGMGMGPGTVLAANNSRLFVLRGNTVFAYDAATLKMVGHTDLPTPQGGPDGRGPDGRGPGGRGGNRPPQGNEDPR